MQGREPISHLEVGHCCNQEVAVYIINAPMGTPMGDPSTTTNSTPTDSHMRVCTLHTHKSHEPQVRHMHARAHSHTQKSHEPRFGTHPKVTHIKLEGHGSMG